MVSALRRDLDICRWPISAQVAHWQLDAYAHLCCHDQKAGIPAEKGDHEYQRATSLCLKISYGYNFASLTSPQRLTFCSFNASSNCPWLTFQ